MDLHPAIRKTLNFIYAGNHKPTHMLSPAAARAHYETTHAFFDMPRPQVAHIEDIIIPGPDANTGNEIPARVYRPASVPVPSSALIFFHGGGWVIGSLKTHDRVCRYLANACNAMIISIDYRLAPEHKFPAPFNDCLAATQWVAQHARRLDIDPARLAIGGDSAGANLAAAVAQAKDAPALAFQMLFYPVTDALGDHPSRSRYSEGFFLEEATIDWFIAQYLRSPLDAADPRVSPLRAKYFTGLPPAFILTAGLDPLCDEGRAYADKLAAAKVPVTYACFDDMIHGFITMGGLIPDARRAMDAAAAAFQKRVAEQP